MIEKRRMPSRALRQQPRLLAHRPGQHDEWRNEECPRGHGDQKPIIQLLHPELLMEKRRMPSRALRPVWQLVRLTEVDSDGETKNALAGIETQFLFQDTEQFR